MGEKELSEWIKEMRQEGHSNNEFRQAMLKTGYSPQSVEKVLKLEGVEEPPRRYFETKRNFLFPVIITIFLLFIIVFSTPLIMKRFGKTSELKVVVPEITTNSDLDGLFFNSLDSTFWHGCNVSMEDSLINLVHIKKDGSEYQISCEYGDSYQDAHLIDMSPDTNVYMGQVRECNVEAAKEIDDVINSGIYDCKIPLDSYKTLPTLNLTDYYLLTLACNFGIVTQEYIDMLQTRETCNKNLKAMMGKRKCIGHVVVIIDSTTSSIFY